MGFRLACWGAGEVVEGGGRNVLFTSGLVLHTMTRSFRCRVHAEGRLRDSRRGLWRIRLARGKEVFLQGYLVSKGEFVEEVDAVCLLDMMDVVSFMHLKLMCL